MDFTSDMFEDTIESYFEKRDHEKGWKMEKESDEIKIWENREETRIFGDTHWVKSTIVITIPFKNVPRVFCRSLLDLIKTNKSVQKCEKIEVEDNSEVYSVVMKIPIPFSSCRFSLVRRRWKCTENVFYHVSKTIPRGERKLEGIKRSYVEAKMMEIRKFEPIGEDMTLCTAFSIMTMGGNLQKIGGILTSLGGKSSMVMKRLKDELAFWKSQESDESYEEEEGESEEESEEESEGSESKEESEEEESEEESEEQERD